MKKYILLTLMSICLMHVHADKIGEWKIYMAYSGISELAQQGDELFAVANGALFSLNTETYDITCYNKQNGLNGTTISKIAYNPQVKKLLICYADGLLDIRDIHGKITALTDLKNKDMNAEKNINHIWMEDDLAYCSMTFGVMVINLQKQEIKDTYYIGKDGAEIKVTATTIVEDSIFAISEGKFYAASLTDNLLDYNVWKEKKSPTTGTLTALNSEDGQIFAIQKSHLYCRQNGVWKVISKDCTVKRLVHCDHLYAMTDTSVYQYKDGALERLFLPVAAKDILPNGGVYWLAAGDLGIVRCDQSGNTEYYLPDGPAVNMPYRLKVANKKLYVVPGGRWASQNNTPGQVMIYDGVQWTNIPNAAITNVTGSAARDFMNVAVDPNDPEHFFVTSYGNGLFEFQNNELYHWYNNMNSPLESAISVDKIDNYIRTDGAIYDEQGNLWLLNAGNLPESVHVLSPEQISRAHTSAYAVWDSINLYLGGYGYERYAINTPQELLIDCRRTNWKWIPSARNPAGLLLLDDNGTPHYDKDDKSYNRYTFVDQDKNVITLDMLHTVAQDKTGKMWLGYDKGLLVISDTTDYRRSSACERIKIPRNDGTNLADYLFNGEQINCIVVDGANRKWVGTETSGLYLMSEDGLETMEHFSTENSPLLSDKIISIAIEPTLGRVYVGTDAGLMSYQSDATQPEEDYEEAFAFPNPVRPDYDGVISISGLMDNSVVKILDNGGNVVFETRSNGGTAVWSGRNNAGKKVASGVYSALCNSASGKEHTVVKILIMR